MTKRPAKFPACATCGIECKSLVYVSTRDHLAYCASHWDAPRDRDMAERKRARPPKQTSLFAAEEAEKE